MNRLTAHIVLVVFDILGIFAVFYVVEDWLEIKELAEAGASSIAYQDFFTLMLLLVVMPIAHLFGFINWKPQHKPLGNGLLIGATIGIGIVAVSLNTQIEKNLASNGYVNCRNLSKTMTFSTFKTYMKAESQCVVSSQK